jgi:hypothetical protein
MTDKKKEEKHPLDMTTDEAMKFLLGDEGAQKLKEGVRQKFPPPDGEKRLKASAKSSRKQDSK